MEPNPIIQPVTVRYERNVHQRVLDSLKNRLARWAAKQFNTNEVPLTSENFELEFEQVPSFAPKDRDLVITVQLPPTTRGFGNDEAKELTETITSVLVGMGDMGKLSIRVKLVATVGDFSTEVKQPVR